MTTRPTPTVHVASAARAPDILVVHEGPRRLRWHTSAPDRWLLVGLWPDRSEVDRLIARVHDDAPVLVVLPGVAATVDVEEHEVAMPLDGFAHVSSEGGVTELTLPLLEWLPEPLRSRGLVFAEQAAAAVAGQPLSLRPPLLVEQLHEDCGVRFARRTGVAMSDAALADAARQAFADRLGPGGASAATNPLVDRSA